MLNVFSASLQKSLGAASLVAVSGLAIRYAFQKKTALDRQIQAVLSRLLVKEWYFPGISVHTKAYAGGLHKPMAVFAEDTQALINSLQAEMVKAVNSHEEFALPNMIIQGPTGVGKTMLLEELCRQLKIGFIRVPSGAMEAHLARGTHIEALHAIKEIASKFDGPVLIIMDDAEELVGKRPPVIKIEPQEDSHASWMSLKKAEETNLQRRVALVNAILEISAEKPRKISFGITTNRFQTIDPAFITRAFVVRVNSPQEKQRKSIVATHLPTIFRGDLNYLTFFDQRMLDHMAKKTEGFSGRDIVRMLERLYACIQVDQGNLTEELIDQIILDIKKHIVRKETAVETVRNIFNSFLQISSKR